MLAAMGVGGTEGMETFYDTCLAVRPHPRRQAYPHWPADSSRAQTLYPPGSCAEDCTPSMMHCRLMEVQSACCADPSNCPEGDPTPHECPVQCALVFPFFLESCGDALAEQGGDMDEYAKFSDACTRQDTTALVEYAVSLKEDGCTVDLGNRRRTEDSDDRAVRADLNSTATRRLQGACDGYADDPNGDLVAHGVTCQQVVALGCDTDLHAMQPELPEGSLVSMLCPVSCNACRRTGMAKWVETAATCPWDLLDDRLDEVNSVCCGEDPDAACPRGAPPRECSALCAVTFHSLVSNCEETLLALAGRANGARFTAFDQLCTSAESVDPLVFLDAIANAECESCRLQTPLS